MVDLKNPRLIWAKGGLFLALGLIASVWLIVDSGSIKLAALHVIAIWAFCRFYYFAFYVIEHYVDGKYRFAGLIDFAKYAVASSRVDRNSSE